MQSTGKAKELIMSVEPKQVRTAFDTARLDEFRAIESSAATLVDVLRLKAQRQADDTAFAFLDDGEVESASVTYRELDRRARSIGAALQSMRAAGERVLLLYPTGLEYISAFLGCLYAGAIAV